jgi:hypothetical protein
VSIVCLDLTEQLAPANNPHIEDWLDTLDASYDDAKEAFIATLLMDLAVRARDEEIVLPHAIAALVSHFYPDINTEINPLSFVGRTGVRLITSDWTRQQFPDAEREIVITLSEDKGQRTHVLLAYL